MVVGPDAVLSCPVAFQSLQAIPGRDAKVIHTARNFQLPKFLAGHRRNVDEPFHRVASRQGFCVGAPERSDHRKMVTGCVINVKRVYRTPCVGRP